MIYTVASSSPELNEIIEQTNNEPRHIWVNGAETIVYTGSDIPHDVESE